MTTPEPPPSLSRARRFSRWLARLGGLALLGAALLVSVDVVCRKWFNVSLAGADEISGYVFGAATAMSMAYAALERAHIRVDVVYRLLPIRMRLVADAIGLAMLCGFIATVAWMAGGFYLDTLQHNSRSITPLRAPLAIPQTFWLAGWLAGLFACVLSLWTLLSLAARGEYRAASEAAGARGTETDAATEDRDGRDET